MSANCFAQNNPPVANDDTITLFSGKSIAYPVVLNDFDPNYDNLSVDTVLYFSGKGTIVKLSWHSVKYFADSLFFGLDTAWYVACDDGTPSLCDTAMILISVDYFRYPAYAQIDINNINARINCDASLFGDLNMDPKFEVPKGDSTNSFFAETIWIGGKDEKDSLHVAAKTYDGTGVVFRPGPVMDSTNYTSIQDSLWNKVWKINRSEIDFHILNWNQPGYIIPQTFLTWPAHGNTSMGQANYLAPFFDYNSDGHYNPADGDYPLIKGDQAVYYILNDDRDFNVGSGVTGLTTEFHIMAYAFDCPADSALWNTLFLNYRIINRSQNSYDSTYLGIWTLGSLGNYNDNFAGCDVERGSYFYYNGDDLDEDYGGEKGYGIFPPAQSITFLAGPRPVEDFKDNPLTYDYDSAFYGNGILYEGLGWGYGDGIFDNERLGLTTFKIHIGGGSVQGYPYLPIHFYYFMSGFWRNGVQMVYGGNGLWSSTIPAKYMFPDATDPLGWGTWGNVQPPWSEVTTGNSPSERKGVGATGPFTFEPGETEELDVAFVFGRDYQTTGAAAGVAVMQQRIDAVREMFANDSTPCGGKFSTGKPIIPNLKSEISLYPNPTSENIIISLPSENKNAIYQIYDLMGRKIDEGKIVAQKQNISLHGFRSGIYLLRIKNNEKIYLKKFVKEK